MSTATTMPPFSHFLETTTYAEPAADSWTQAERVFWVVFESVAKKHPGLRNVLLGDMVALIEAALAGQHSERTAPAEPLTLAQISKCARNAQILFCLDKYGSFEVAFARLIEAALAASQAERPAGREGA